MATPKQGHWLVDWLQALAQRGNIRGADRLKTQLYIAATALPQGRPQGIAAQGQTRCGAVLHQAAGVANRIKFELSAAHSAQSLRLCLRLCLHKNSHPSAHLARHRAPHCGHNHQHGRGLNQALQQQFKSVHSTEIVHEGLACSWA